MAMFHYNHGRHMAVSPNGKRAVALDKDSVWHKTLFSLDPLEEGVAFNLRIEKKTHAKSPQICIGVTSLEPEEHMPPSDAAATNHAWILAGPHLYQHGKYVRDYQGLMSVKRGDTIGILWKDGKVSFTKNHRNLGLAFPDVRGPVWAVVELWNVDQFSIIDTPAVNGTHNQATNTSNGDVEETILLSATPRTRRCVDAGIKRKPFLT